MDKEVLGTISVAFGNMHAHIETFCAVLLKGQNWINDPINSKELSQNLKATSLGKEGGS